MVDGGGRPGFSLLHPHLIAHPSTTLSGFNLNIYIIDKLSRANIDLPHHTIEIVLMTPRNFYSFFCN